ncbi:hypothetical protein [Falsigemmobacter faecalis]|uniref:Uncharacterized protein n=1 Tax=Falsigemmobacter faecalis TaxID=2488730 RepID=A0A3P3D700_9RHOB|nr:hypothetical protein [Falsigemmobacter faecalis]RRH70160.1 hypothetical protein EG244_17385 [Falsigemmobacter faecalis]
MWLRSAPGQEQKRAHTSGVKVRKHAGVAKDPLRRVTEHSQSARSIRQISGKGASQAAFEINHCLCQLTIRPEAIHACPCDFSLVLQTGTDVRVARIYAG